MIRALDPLALLRCKRASQLARQIVEQGGHRPERAAQIVNHHVQEGAAQVSQALQAQNRFAQTAFAFS